MIGNGEGKRISLGRFGKKPYDVIIIGAGPAGISAAINAAVRKKRALILDSREPMGKIRKAREIKNYPGFPRATGEEVASALLCHPLEMGVEIRKAKVGEVVKGKNFMIYTEKDRVKARSLILAVGVTIAKKLPGEEELLGQGVSYCITCDGAVYSGEKVVVISESDEGEEEAKALVQDYGCAVTYVPLYEMEGPREFEILKCNPRALRARGKQVTVDFGDQKLLVRAVFLIKSVIPPASLIKGLKMEGKHIAVNKGMETSIPGMFAAGDCTGSPYQIAKAIGQGQIAALSAVKYLAALDAQKAEVKQ
jgi:thioredoxin reductase (NADPH)